MPTTKNILSAAALLFTVVSATFIAPASNSSWALNTKHTVKWDTAGLQEPLQMHLCPGGSKDTSLSIATLAPSIPNSGYWTWHPTSSIPKHQSFTIIIIDNSGYYHASPNFYLYGWPKQQHTTVVQTVVHTQPVYSTPPHPPPVYTTILHTSIIEQSPSVHIVPVLVTSQVAPVIKTIQAPPIVKTEEVAPIILTQTQEPVTKIISQAPIQTTEYQAPIVKTILVTETPPPIIKYIPQPPLTIIKTQDPVILTKTQAPIVTTIIQPPYVITEHLSPVVITEHKTKTIHFPPVHTVITEHVSLPVHTPVVYAPPPVHTSVAVHVSPVYQNTTSIELSSFEKPTSIEGILTETSSLSLTSPTALGATGFSTSFSMGAAASTGLGGLQGSFTGASAKIELVRGSMLWIGLVSLTMWMI